MSEFVGKGPMVGEVQPAESKTIKNINRANLTIAIGGGLAWLADHSAEVQAALLTVVPANCYGYAVGTVQILTIVGTMFFGKKAIKARIDATQKIAPITKTHPGMFSFVFMSFWAGCLLLLLSQYAKAQANPLVTLSWIDAQMPAVKGYRIFQGETTDTLVQIAELPATARTYKFSFPLMPQDAKPQCFGIQAFNDLGLSSTTTRMDDGTPLCLGKPSAPRGLSYSVT